MTDIRARLTAALERELDEHGYEDDDEKRGQVAHHFADVLLSLAGIAVVELPNVNVWDLDEVKFGVNPMTPDLARGIAAGLLAAASAAEQQGASNE